MSSSCVFHLQVWPSAPSRSAGLSRALEKFLDEVGLSSALAVETASLEGITVLRATSEWAIAISGAASWIPEVEARFERLLRASDPECELSFGARSPDDDEESSIHAVLGMTPLRPDASTHSSQASPFPGARRSRSPRATWISWSRDSSPSGTSSASPTARATPFRGCSRGTVAVGSKYPCPQREAPTGSTSAPGSFARS